MAEVHKQKNQAILIKKNKILPSILRAQTGNEPGVPEWKPKILIIIPWKPLVI